MKCAGEAGSYRPDQQHPPSHTHHMDQQLAHRFTLAFKDNQIESNFKAWYDEAAAAHDQQVRFAATEQFNYNMCCCTATQHTTSKHPSVSAVG